MGMLARMCQASYLLGLVLRYNRNRTESAPSSAGFNDHEEYWQLDKTINALLNLSYVEGEIRRTAVCAQTSICYRYASVASLSTCQSFFYVLSYLTL